MRFKGVAFLSACLATALAMAVSEPNVGTSPGVVEAADKKINLGDASSGVSGEANQATVHYDLAAIKRTTPENFQTGELFRAKSWYAPPPPPPAAQNLSPPPPSAPPLAFTFLGRMIDGNEMVVFLSKNGRNYVVKANEIFDDNYRVDKITPTDMVLTYLPMGIQQTLPLNSTAVGSSALTTAPLQPASTTR